MTIWLATSNPGKRRDFAGLAFRGTRGAAALGPAPTIDPGVEVDLELLPGFASLPEAAETGSSFEANARIKAEHYSRLAAGWVVADDSGLEVEALGGAPGIFSARFAGRHVDDAANNRLLLERLEGVPAARRAAAFVCVLALAQAGATVATFSGRIDGVILEAPRGDLGFGYDPLFFSPEAGRALAQLDAAAKARISHRGRAARALLKWIRTWPHPANPPLP